MMLFFVEGGKFFLIFLFCRSNKFRCCCLEVFKDKDLKFLCMILNLRVLGFLGVKFYFFVCIVC